MNHSFRSNYIKILLGLVGIYITIFGTVAVLRHSNFQTQTWDMGAFEQTFWNTSQGRIMQNSLEEAPNHLGVHVSPWLFLLVPGYALFPSPYYLLIVQTIALGLGAIPLFWLARKIIDSEKWALVISGAYLLYPSLHWVNLFDFHSISFLPPLLLMAWYFFENKKWGWMTLFLLFAASTKEDAILVVAFTGIFMAIRPKLSFSPSKLSLGRREKIAGILTALFMFIYFFVAIKFLMPALGGGLLRLDRYTNLGGSIPEILRNIATHPWVIFTTAFTLPKLQYLFFLFLPVAFLPFFGWRALVLLIPGLAENLLTEFGFQFSNFYQYDAVLIAGIFIASVYGVREFLKRWPGREKYLKWTLVSAAIIGFLVQSPLNPVGFPYFLFRQQPEWVAYRKLIQAVPEDVSVAAHTNLVPHLAHREQIFMLGREPFPPDILIVDGEDPFGFPDIATFQAYIDQYQNSGLYEVRVLQNRYAILSKKEIPITLE